MTGLLPVIDRRPTPHFVCTKTQYSKVEAKTALNARERSGVRGLRVYECPKCNAWHLTSKTHYDE